ncbi:MAG: DUF6291 domain-containing protein [Clostridia bacterium]
MERESFIVYKSFYALIKLLPIKERLQMYEAIFDYGFTEVEPGFASDAQSAIWQAIKPQLKANNKRYENSKNGGAPQGNSNAKKYNQTPTNETTEKQPNSDKKNNLDTQNKTTETMQNKTTEKQPNENVNENVNVNVNDICAVPEIVTPPEALQNDIFLTLILNTKDEFPILKQDVEERQALYPSVDVKQEFRNMKGWLIDNPTHRKTKSGIMRFVNGWLSREQNKGSQSLPVRQSKPQHTSNFNGRNYSAEEVNNAVTPICNLAKIEL